MSSRSGSRCCALPSGTGHSIGQVHADGWLIPYYDSSINEGRVLEKGMVITVEPFICAGSGAGIRLNNVTRSAQTADKSLAVYWEHVVAVTRIRLRSAGSA